MIIFLQNIQQKVWFINWESHGAIRRVISAFKYVRLCTVPSSSFGLQRAISTEVTVMQFCATPTRG